MKPEVSAALEAAWEFVKALTPGAFGAAVAVTFDKTSTFARRILQFAVGIVVSYYVSAAIKEYLEMGPMVSQGVSFTVGMIAYQSVPKFTASASDVIGKMPTELWGWVKTKIGIAE